MEENLEMIQAEIDKNTHIEDDEGRENMRAMVKDRYSVF
jgi:hypothetical protein